MYDVYCSMLDRVRAENEGRPRDPYSDKDDNNAAFYRLPAGFRRAKHNQEKEEAGMIGFENFKSTSLLKVVFYEILNDLNLKKNILVYSNMTVLVHSQYFFACFLLSLYICHCFFFKPGN